ncbi:ATP-dependent 6-phosphofructokinase 7-like [Gastrolobium bilobum]|uniref:ATP-dependent 6-phosphofructokinase 7-like n=1 Tax=Gastrolobium bilobum TaxID=150636 RepID=UPI002AB2206B|nr:ATP-dependent 6-phosphofructokinase 7-like [Gastrolobium bilobum]
MAERVLPFLFCFTDPTYMIRAVPSNASDNVYCTLLAQSAVHRAMAGYTGYTSGLVNGRQTYIPFYRITERQNHVVITDRMWARLLSSTNQPSFLGAKDDNEVKKGEEPLDQLQDGHYSDVTLVNKEISYTMILLLSMQLLNNLTGRALTPL